MALADLEIKRLKLELVRVNAAKEEHLFKIEEKLDEIERIKEQVKIQEKRALEVAQKLQELNAKK